MANKEHLSILKQGAASWNDWMKIKENIYVIPDFSGADLTDADLLSANLNRANLSKANLFDADLSGADLSGADLSEADLSGADLSDANLNRANLSKANLNRANFFDAQLREADLSRAQLINAELVSTNLSKANLNRANLSDSNLNGANLSNSNLNEANFSCANLFDVNLIGANLSNANLIKASLRNINFDKAILHGARTGWTIFARVDLSGATGLDGVIHEGPSTIGTDTIQKSGGRIPEIFLRRCGMSSWETEMARLYDLSLPLKSISTILKNTILKKRTEGNIFAGGVFVSFSDADSGFVDKLYRYLDNAGASVWLDRHDPSPNNLHKGIMREVRLRDVVILVLSENSVSSEWTENELQIARNKEKYEDQDLLCPVAIDSSWVDKAMTNVLWRQLRSKKVLDFSAWNTPEIASQFEQLLNRLKINYEGKG